MRKGLSMLFWLFNLAAHAQGGKQERGLTVGVANEMQNSLNYINNFSALKKDLLLESKQDLSCGYYNESEEIHHGFKQYKEKIIDHGRGVHSIVKSRIEFNWRFGTKNQPAGIYFKNSNELT